MMRALAPHAARGEIELIVALPDANDAIEVPEAPGLTSVVIRGVNSLPRRLLWMQFELPRLARRVGAEVIWAPANVGPLRPKLPMIMTLQVTSAASAFAPPSLRVWWGAMTALSRLSARSAAEVLSVSEYLRDYIIDRWGLPATKVVTVPYGVGPPFNSVRPEAPAPVRPVPRFILYVGDFQRHKNLPRLVHAFASLAAEFPDLSLVFAGAFIGSEVAVVRERIESHALQDRSVMLGRVSATELAGLFKGAEVVIMPSLAESFGLPLLEAMACGAAVVASNIPALKEVGGGVSLHFPPNDAAAMAREIARVLRDRELADRLRAAGPARAALYSWDRAAEETIAAFRRAAKP
jgi:glycosyltransferase involved in cell wall biosynthesis